MGRKFHAQALCVFVFAFSLPSARAGIFSQVGCTTSILGNIFKESVSSHSEPVVSKLAPLPAGFHMQPSDPYDPIGLITTGEYKGQVVDTHIKRPAHIVYESNDEILFANFRDNNDFHQAHVKKNGVDSVYFRIKRFPSGINGVTPAHTALYFKMKPGSEIMLEGAHNAQDLSHPTFVSDFIFSIDYIALGMFLTV